MARGRPAPLRRNAEGPTGDALLRAGDSRPPSTPPAYTSGQTPSTDLVTNGGQEASSWEGANILTGDLKHQDSITWESP